MTPGRLRPLRLRHQRLSAPAPTLAAAASHMLATQAQEFWGGRLALAARTRGFPSMRAVDAAFDRGDLVRSWPMRGTLHITPAADLAWILGVTGERMRSAARSVHLAAGLDADGTARAERVLVAALRGGNALTRAEAFAALAAGGIDPSGQRGYHVLSGLAMRAIVCWGPVVERPGWPTREQRIVLIEEWVSEHAAPADPLAELLVRYIDGHGPADAADFAWWSGLPIGTARRALEAAGDRVAPIELGGQTLFVSPAPGRASPGAPDVLALPPFEEYFLPYADRARVCAPEFLAAVGPGQNGVVRPILVARGEVVGTWAPPRAGARAGAPPVARVLDPDAVTAPDVDAALARYSSFAAS